MKRFLKISALFLTVALFAGILGGCGDSVDPATIEYVQLAAPQDGDDIAVFDTSMGEITVLLYSDEVPAIVDNFKAMVEQGFYDGQVVFHVEPLVGVVASGSSTADGNGGDSSTGKPIKAEYSDNLWPFTGSLSALCYETGAFWSKGYYFDSRYFFIGEAPVTEDTVAEMETYNFPTMMIEIFKDYGGVPQFGRAHSVFGKVIQGMDIVNEMLKVKLTYESMSAEDVSSEEEAEYINNPPVEDIVINTVTLGTYKEGMFETLDNCLTDDEVEALEDRATEIDAEKTLEESSAAE